VWLFGSEQPISRKLAETTVTSPLEEVLRRVAPQKEVLIAISNYQLVLEGALVTWQEVRRSKSCYLAKIKTFDSGQSNSDACSVCRSWA
jgi:hypothetical protein